MQFISARKSDVRNEVTISVTGEIGWDFDGGAMINYLRTWHDASEKLILDIFSFGGSAFHALAVYDFIKTNGYSVDVNVYGMCGSAATIFACAAEVVNMGENSFFFIHNAYDETSGKEDETTAKVTDRIIQIYKAKTGLDIRTIRRLMNEGNEGAIMGAEEAKQWGFVDNIIKEKKSVAALIQDRFLPGNADSNNDNNQKAMDFQTIQNFFKTAFGRDVKNEDEAKAAMEELQANPPSVSATADIEKLTGRISALEGKVQANAQLQINDDAFQQMQAKVNALAEQVVALSEANAKLVEQLQEVETQREEETDEFTQRMEAISNNIQRASLFRKAESPKEGAPAVSAQAAIEEAAAGKNVVKSEGMDAILAKYQKGATAKN